jgi:hypothetical protein
MMFKGDKYRFFLLKKGNSPLVYLYFMFSLNMETAIIVPRIEGILKSFAYF